MWETTDPTETCQFGEIYVFEAVDYAQYALITSTTGIWAQGSIDNILGPTPYPPTTAEPKVDSFVGTSKNIRIELGPEILNQQIWLVQSRGVASKVKISVQLRPG